MFLEAPSQTYPALTRRAVWNKPSGKSVGPPHRPQPEGLQPRGLTAAAWVAQGCFLYGWSKWLRVSQVEAYTSGMSTRCFLTLHSFPECPVRSPGPRTGAQTLALPRGACSLAGPSYSRGSAPEGYRMAPLVTCSSLLPPPASSLLSDPHPWAQGVNAQTWHHMWLVAEILFLLYFHKGLCCDFLKTTNVQIPSSCGDSPLQIGMADRGRMLGGEGEGWGWFGLGAGGRAGRGRALHCRITGTPFREEGEEPWASSLYFPAHHRGAHSHRREQGSPQGTDWGTLVPGPQPPVKADRGAAIR